MSDLGSQPSATTPVSGWSVETAMFHLLSVTASNDRRYEQRFEAQEKAVGNAIFAADRAVVKAEAATEKRFESVNEFRATLSDQQRTFMPRSESDAIIKALDVRLQRMEELARVGQAERAGIQGGWGYAVGVAGFVALLAGAAFAAFK